MIIRTNAKNKELNKVYISNNNYNYLNNNINIQNIDFFHVKCTIYCIYEYF